VAPTEGQKPPESHPQEPFTANISVNLGKTEFYRNEPIHICYIIGNIGGNSDNIRNKCIEIILPPNFNFTDMNKITVNYPDKMSPEGVIINSNSIYIPLKLSKEDMTLTNISYDIIYNPLVKPPDHKIDLLSSNFVRQKWDDPIIKLKKLPTNSVITIRNAPPQILIFKIYHKIYLILVRQSNFYAKCMIWTAHQ